MTDKQIAFMSACIVTLAACCTVIVAAGLVKLLGVM